MAGYEERYTFPFEGIERSKLEAGCNSESQIGKKQDRRRAERSKIDLKSNWNKRRKDMGIQIRQET